MAAKAGKLNFEIEQGADFYRLFEYTTDDPTPVPINLTGCTFAGQIRQTKESSTPVATFVFENVNLAQGKFAAKLSASVTSGMDMSEAGYYDIEITYPGGAVERFLEGRIVLNKEVTR